MNVDINLKMSGKFSVKRINSITEEIIQELAPFSNTITNLGLEYIGTSSPIYYCYLGSGTTPSSNTDTQMGHFLLNATVTTASTNRSLTTPYWVEESITWRFAPSGSNYNITEVGTGWGSSDINSLWSRALTVDELGNPVTITLLADEYLDVTYTLRFYPPITDQTYNVTINGIDYSFTTRTANVTTALVNSRTYSMGGGNNIFMTVFGGPCTLGSLEGSIENSTDSSGTAWFYPNAYIANSKKVSGNFSLTPIMGNVSGGITGFTTSMSSIMLDWKTQTTVSPAIPKDNVSTLNLTYEYSWSQY